jgi:cell division inhibitor SepF
MSSMWRKAMVHLGLGDDDEYDDYESAPVRRSPAPLPPLDDEPDVATSRTSRPAAQPTQARAAQPRSVQPVANRTATVSTLPAQETSGGTTARPSNQGGGPMRFPNQGGPPEQPTVRPVAADDSRASSPAISGVRTIPRPSAKPHVVAPRSFSDAQEVGDNFKSKQPVIINLQGVDRDLSRRLVDFTSGLCYGLGGQMEKIATDVFLLTPLDVEVSPEERQRLQERGLYAT